MHETLWIYKEWSTDARDIYGFRSNEFRRNQTQFNQKIMLYIGTTSRAASAEFRIKFLSITHAKKLVFNSQLLR